MTGHEQTKLEQRFASRTDSAIDAVQQYIISQELGPGDPLPTEAELCKLLGMSRSSVGKDSLSTLDEVVTLRKYLDLGMGQELIHVNQTQNAVTGHLRQLVAKMVKKSAAGKAYIREDIAFHRGLIACLDNKLLDETMSAMWMIHMAVVPSLPADLDGLVATARAHGAMLEAIEKGDV